MAHRPAIKSFFVALIIAYASTSLVACSMAPLEFDNQTSKRELVVAAFFLDAQNLYIKAQERERFKLQRGARAV